MKPTNCIAFQGEPGAYSHQACRQARPDMEALPCPTFEETVEACRSGAADLAMLPVENSTYGRVADIHHLLPESGLHILDETFVRVHISLLGVPGARLQDVREAMSHTVLLGQCRGFLRQHGIRTVTAADTAGSALAVAEARDPQRAALASPLAGEIYGLTPLAEQIEDRGNNTTRFLIMGRTPDRTPRSNASGGTQMMTSFVFRVRNIPAALYKAMGGFATNGVNMTKLESYMVDGVFTATQFYADVEGHPDEPALARALEELTYFTSSLTILGVYPADPLRASQAVAGT
ncbi:prephenate dehydratase [Paracoccus suum]|uniref:prephenate dehydratase n=1 Tax=Paracoccus suum TaxID=2259340 RepID=A0A344PKN5_9RHOB|nr:prephenate dehydratase [Paracoccus suum]AXC49940.1 prephenate dehydratase [Paracoccus suum]